jgi:hypothetical protein
MAVESPTTYLLAWNPKNFAWNELPRLVQAAPKPWSPKAGDEPRVRGPVRVDFVERDAWSRELGRKGEEWALEFERRRLYDIEERPDLARRVEWVSQTPR